MNFKLVDCVLYYNDEPERIIDGYLCAVAKYDEDNKDCQDWDDLIFFWFEDEEELESYKEKDENAEFTIINYSIR